MTPASRWPRRSRRWWEKRAVGYKYDAEERVLARFPAFSAAVPRAWTRPPGAR